MSKKTNLFKLLACAAVILALCLGATMTAFAAEPDFPHAAGTPENPAEAGLTKILQMPIGTITPDVTFTFKFEKKALDGDQTDPAKAIMPAIGNKDIEFEAADDPAPNGGVKYIPKETGDVLPQSWPRAGVYEYTVTEVGSDKKYPVIDDNNTPTDPSDDFIKENMTYSPAVYTMRVYVDNGPNGPYAKYVTAQVITKDNNGQTQDAKVDPTPGEENSEGDYSQMIFTNTYLKNNGGINPPTDPDKAVFALSKAVSGLSADQTKPFTFSVTVNSPAVGVAAGATYKAYIFTGTTINPTPIIFTSGTLKNDITLTHGQKLVFIDLPVGSSFDVTEAAASDYTASCALRFNGQTTDLTLNAAKQGDPLGTGSRFIGETENKADFTNAYKTVTPAGIGVDDLPYLVLIGVVLVALAAFGAVKLRKRANQH